MTKKQFNIDPDKSDEKPKRRWLIPVLSLFLIAISLIPIYYLAENSAEKRFLDLVNSELSPNSEILIDDFSLTLLPLGISIKGITLLKDQSLDELTSPKPADAIRNLQIDDLTLTGIRLIALLRNDHIELSRFSLRGVHVDVVRLESMHQSDSEKVRNPFRISVSDIQLSDLNITFFDTPVADSSSTEIQSLSGNITDFYLKDPSQLNRSTFEKLEISMYHFSHYTENGYYEVSLDSFLLNSVDGQLTFNQFHLRPLISAYEMALDIGYPNDNFDFKIPHFKIEEIDLNRWLSDQDIIAGKISLTEPVVSISRDKSLPRRERDDRLLPHIQFKHLPFFVSVDTVFVEKGTLSYHEETAVENRAGSISFNEIDLSLYSMKNRSPDPILAEATALFMNQSEFDLNVEFSLDDIGNHSVTGNLYQLDLTSMNTTFVNLVQIRMDSGDIQQLNFQFEANDNQAYGSLLLIYSDLDLRFIDAEERTESGWDRVRSFIANTFVIRSDNSPEDPRSGEIEFDREKERSIFNFWLRSISTGLVDTIKR